MSGELRVGETEGRLVVGGVRTWTVYGPAGPTFVKARDYTEVLKELGLPIEETDGIEPLDFGGFVVLFKGRKFTMRPLAGEGR
jgi:hypothetical protein